MQGRKIRFEGESKEMESVYDELGEAQAEIEKLRAENRQKRELAEGLKRAHSEQMMKIQEANSKLEKQARELDEKEGDISVAKQMYNELNSKLKEKEAVIRNLNAANEKLRSDTNEKLQKQEEENRELASSLAEVTDTNTDQERRIRGLRNEIECLKEMLSVSQRKPECPKASERNGDASKELRQRDDMMLRMEEEHRKVEDQLKWKKEQFGHLQEAHEKLRDQLRAKEKEWKKEKSELLDMISTMETNLHSQIRSSKDLESQLQMCNQALSHEESRRKFLEIQLSESRGHIDSISSECDEANSKLECLTSQRDEQIASLRNHLGKREVIYKEMEYQVRKLEQENRELKVSLKELQEEMIRESRPASVSKLRNKLRDLEQKHKACSTYSKAKEAEWSSQLERLTGDLTCCRCELDQKHAMIRRLEQDLKDCHSSVFELALKKYEYSFQALFLKSEIMQAQSKLADEKNGMYQQIKEREDELSNLRIELEMKNAVVIEAEIESFEQQKLMLQNEIDGQIQMLKESSASEARLKEQLLQMESDLERVSEALNKANDELAESFCEAHEIEFELQIWRSIAERLKSNLEESYQTRREVEASLLSQVDVEVALKQEKDTLVCALTEKDRRIEHLEILLDSHDARQADMKQKGQVSEDLVEEGQELVVKDSDGAILAKSGAERTSKSNEKKKLHQLVEEKDQRIENLQKLMKSLEQEFDRSTSAFSAQLAKMQTEIHKFYGAWEKSKTAGILKEIEVQEKILIIVELEGDLSNLQQKLELQEKSLSGLRNKRLEIEAETEAQRFEVRRLTQELEKGQQNSDVLVKELQDENLNLTECIVKLTSDRDTLMGTMEELYQKMHALSNEDVQHLVMLDKMVQKIERNEMQEDNEKFDEFHNPVKENIVPLSPMGTKCEVALDGRSPLRTLN